MTALSKQPLLQADPPILQLALELVVCALIFSGRCQAIDLSELVQQAQYCLVKVHVTGINANGSGINDWGSGILLSRQAGFVLTAGHVIPEAKDTQYDITGTVYGETGTETAALQLVERSRSGNDAALLRFSSEIHAGNPISIKPRGLAKAEPVTVLGFPLGLDDFEVGPGIVTGFRDTKKTLWFTNAPINPGDSGAPIFDKDGNVIGLALGAITEYNNRSVQGMSQGLAALGFNDLLGDVPSAKGGERNPASLGPPPSKLVVSYLRTDDTPVRAETGFIFSKILSVKDAPGSVSNIAPHILAKISDNGKAIVIKYSGLQTGSPEWKGSWRLVIRTLQNRHLD